MILTMRHAAPAKCIQLRDDELRERRRRRNGKRGTLCPRAPERPCHEDKTTARLPNMGVERAGNAEATRLTAGKIDYGHQLHLHRACHRRRR